jgi:hypothetical protein
MLDNYYLNRGKSIKIKRVIAGCMAIGTIFIMSSSSNLKNLRINNRIVIKPVEHNLVSNNNNNNSSSTSSAVASSEVVVSSQAPIVDNSSMVSSQIEVKKYDLGNDELIEKYGQFTLWGMPYEGYLKAMDNKFEEILFEQSNDDDLNYDLTKLYRYADIEKYLYELGKNSNVRLYQLGTSSEQRKIYGIEVGTGSKVIMLTGNLHGNEGAGTGYILKSISDLLNKSNNDSYLKLLLENVKIVAIPCVNPDGREINITQNINYWKANGLGIDLNANFPSSEASVLSNKEKMDIGIKITPGPNAFPGYKLGDANETKVLMKWFEQYIVKEQAFCHIDYHQQGRVIYCTNFYGTDERNNNAKDFVSSLVSFFNNNNNNMPNFANIGTNTLMDGSGGGATYYANNLADGFVMSKKYGRLGMLKDDNVELALIFGKLTKDNTYYKPANFDFVNCTLEIGTKATVGYDMESLKNQSEEYYNYNYGNIPILLMEKCLGQEKINELKEQAKAKVLIMK